ncbi:MAG: hypothetical protein GXP55_22335 [Deltaproteobacteria bacterium]|nr:hypothetical protein [Deltaproteobacteria bacterium]
MRDEIDPRSSLFQVCLLAVAMVATGCGGVSRNYLIEERSDAGELIDAINQAAIARGFDTRVREGRLVKFYVDRDAGTVLYFQAKRRGIVLVVRTNGGEEVPLEVQEQEFARGEELGRTLLQEAHVLYGQIQAQQQRELAAQQQREQAAADERARQAASQPAQPQQDNSMLQGFMQRHQGSNRPSASSSPARPAQASASAQCCVNGAFYACPNAGAVDQCVGRFTRCISGCGLECIEQCMSTDPPDPSACTRDASRDGEC